MKILDCQPSDYSIAMKHAEKRTPRIHVVAVTIDPVEVGVGAGVGLGVGKAKSRTLSNNTVSLAILSAISAKGTLNLAISDPMIMVGMS